jgi:hypothetical protein
MTENRAVELANKQKRLANRVKHHNPSSFRRLLRRGHKLLLDDKPVTEDMLRPWLPTSLGKADRRRIKIVSPPKPQVDDRLPKPSSL